jgi:hypothetical protein
MEFYCQFICSHHHPTYIMFFRHHMLGVYSSLHTVYIQIRIRLSSERVRCCCADALHHTLRRRGAEQRTNYLYVKIFFLLKKNIPRTNYIHRTGSSCFSLRVFPPCSLYMNDVTNLGLHRLLTTQLINLLSYSY